jgi:hypothetical protein
MANVSGICAVSLAPTLVISSGLISQANIGVTISTPSVPLASITYANGTGAGAVDLMYEAAISLASTTLTIDLTSLTAPDGSAVNFARIRELYVLNYSATAGFDLLVEQGATNPWAYVPATANAFKCAANGGQYYLRDLNSTGAGNGLVTGGSSKTIKFDSGAHTVTFYLLLLGTSVA